MAGVDVEHAVAVEEGRGPDQQARDVLAGLLQRLRQADILEVAFEALAAQQAGVCQLRKHLRLDRARQLHVVENVAAHHVDAGADQALLGRLPRSSR